MAENRTTSMSGGRFALVLALSLVAMAGLVVGCGDMAGTATVNQRPIVEFTNVPADQDTFSYAPVVTWKGRDADGFVEHYSYADIIDSTALLDPQYYINFIPEEAWIQTAATSDTVYLLTESGAITQHVFYLKCTDDRDAESVITYRTFYRTNLPPRVPEVKWMFYSDSAYHENSIVPDTLYSLDEPNETWPGLGFNWRSSDPDDRELYRIPLEYRYYLERVPHDTVWEWTARNWTTKQDLVFAGLPTGHYVFSVWARDDGYEVSARPATATFDVYQPSFEQSILLFNCTTENPNARAGFGNIIPGTQIGDLYKMLASDYPDVEYHHYTTSEGMILHKAFLGRFRLVIWFSENAAKTEALFQGKVRDYVRVGGKLWVIGELARQNIISDSTMSLMGSTFAGATGGVTISRTFDAEFTGAVSGVDGLPDLVIDTSKTSSSFREYWNGAFRTFPCLPGIDIMSAGSGAESAYYFKSYTDTASGDVSNDLATVKANIDTIYYPPTPVDCLIKLGRSRVLEVTRVENTTRGITGQVVTLTNNVGSTNQTVVKVSYPYGEPWATTDTVRVDYRFQPYSDNSLRPVGVRYERLVSDEGSTYIVRYRVAVFTFPLYYMDNSQGAVTQMFKSMLNWFFLPYAH